MKSLLLVTSALAAFAAAPALAQDGPVGSVGVSYGNTEFDLGGVGGDADSWAVDGVVAMPAFGEWTVTVAANASEFEDADDTTLVGTAHLTTLVGSDLRVGGFVGAADVADESALTGVVAYTTADDADLDVWSVGGDAAFYVTDALRLNAGVSWMTIEDADVDGVTYGVGAEYQIAGTPFSATAGYSNSDIEDLDVDSWTVGLRYSFGGGLQARDRAGAALPGSGVMGLLGAL